MTMPAADVLLSRCQFDRVGFCLTNSKLGKELVAQKLSSALILTADGRC